MLREFSLSDTDLRLDMAVRNLTRITVRTYRVNRFVPNVRILPFCRPSFVAVAADIHCGPKD